MASFSLPPLSENISGWGPSSSPCAYEGLPFLPYSKSDKLNRIADWTSSVRYARQPDISSSSAFSFSNEDDGSFTIVDNQLVQSKYSRTKRGNQYNRPNRQYTNYSQQSQQPQRKSNYQAPRTGKRWKIHAQRYQRYVEKRTYDPSIVVKPEWTVAESIDLAALKKVVSEEPTGEDICCVGKIKVFDSSYTNMFARNERPLQNQSAVFFNRIANVDPVLQKIKEKGIGNVFASDSVIALLMASTRSVYPWDIVVKREGANLYFYRRAKSQIELLSVGENLLEPPSHDGETLNSAKSLSREATVINQFFARQLVNEEESVDISDNADLIPEDFEIGNEYRGYRYRKFALRDSVNLVVRCDVDGVDLGKDGEKKFMVIQALNEYDTKMTGNWRAKLDTQPGAAFASELKANSCKMAKWSAKTMLSGADQITLGYISRQLRTPTQHSILKVQHYKPSEFANNVAVSPKNQWGIIKALVDLFLQKEDGKYVLMKEPNKDVLLLYKIPNVNGEATA